MDEVQQYGQRKGGKNSIEEFVRGEQAWMGMEENDQIRAGMDESKKW